MLQYSNFVTSMRHIIIIIVLLFQASHIELKLELKLRLEVELKLEWGDWDWDCGSLWAMWHPHAPLANDAASGSLSRKNVLIAGVGSGNGGEMLLLRIHKELIKNTKSRRSCHDNAKRDGRRYKNEEIYMPNLYLAILKPQSVCLPVCPSVCPSFPLSVCGTGAVAGFCSDLYF